MQTQHSISVASKIRRELPPKVAAQVEQLHILLVGEQVEQDKGGATITKKGVIEVRGTAVNVQGQSVVIEAIKAKAEGRQVINMTSVKRASNPFGRKGLFG